MCPYTCKVSLIKISTKLSLIIFPISWLGQIGNNIKREGISALVSSVSKNHMLSYVTGVPGINIIHAIAIYYKTRY